MVVPTGYFSDTGPELGSEALQTTWRGTSLWFGSEDNRARFPAHAVERPGKLPGSDPNPLRTLGIIAGPR